MAVSVLQAAAGNSLGVPNDYDVIDGPNRVFYLIEARTSGTAAQPYTSGTFGGLPLERIAFGFQATWDTAAAIWIMGEAALASKADNVIIMSGGSFFDDQGAVAGVLQDVSQEGDWTAAFGVASATSGAESLSRGAGSHTVAATVFNSNTLGTLSNPNHTIRNTIGTATGSIAFGDAQDTLGVSDIVWTGAGGDTSTAGANFLPAPRITSITPDPQNTSAQVTITGVGFLPYTNLTPIRQSQGAVFAFMFETSRTDTEIVATLANIEESPLKYGTTSVKVANDNTSGSLDHVVIPPVNNSYVDLTSLAATDNRITTVADLEIGDQLRYQAILHKGDTPTAFTVVINPNGTFSIDGSTPEGAYNFEVRAWNQTNTVWGTPADQIIVIGSPYKDAEGKTWRWDLGATGAGGTYNSNELTP